MKFQDVREDIIQDERYCHPATSRTYQNVERVTEMERKDCWATVSETAEGMNINWKTMGLTDQRSENKEGMCQNGTEISYWWAANEGKKLARISNEDVKRTQPSRKNSDW